MMLKNNLPDVSTLVKTADYDTKKMVVTYKKLHQKHNKYITSLEFHKSMSENFEARLKQANLSTKDEISDFNDKLKNLNKKTI